MFGKRACHDPAPSPPPEGGGAPGTASRERASLIPAGSSILDTTGPIIGLVILFDLVTGAILLGVYLRCALVIPHARQVILATLGGAFCGLLVVSGVAAWLLATAHARRRAALKEAALRTSMLMAEISAHKRTDAALQKAKEVAESANAAKSRYLVGVSHEIRSPLNAIYGYAQLLERDAGVTPNEAGRMIRRSSEHLSNLVEGLLDISRIESGVLRLSRDRVAFIEFLDQIADMFRMQAEAKGIAFSFERPKRLPAFVRTDQKRLRQILTNLLSNAVKYTHAGHAKLILRYRGQVAEFEIVDTGIGIRAEDLEAIFEPFERGGMEAAQSMPGIGLGLAITKVLTHVLGGEISVSSEPGKGSRFTVKIMLPEPFDVATDAYYRPRIRGYGGERKTLLLVDDNPAHLAVIQHLLTPLGFIVHLAANGTAGLELAARCQPDLVLLDIQMPGMSGWQVAARLREQSPSRLKVIMVSANAHERPPGGESGSPHDAFLMKPVELDVLLDRIGDQLGLTWLHGETALRNLESGMDDAAPAPGALVHINELYQLGRIGHVRAIESKLNEMEAQDVANGPFVARLRRLIRAFDLKSYVAILNALRTHG
jgi:signal transduction histidine kinase